MLSLIELFRSKQKGHAQPSDEDIQLELQIQRDIQDVFADLFEEDEELELTTAEPAREPTPPPLRSEGTVSKRKLQEAVDSLLPEHGRPQVEDESTRKRSRFDAVETGSSLASSSTFRPFSADALTSRLSTFTLPSFISSSFSARDAAEKGWENKGRERLVCKECKAAWVVSDLKGLKPQTAEKLKVRLRTELVEAHKASCPWRVMASGTAASSIPADFVPPTTSHLLNLASALLSVLPSGLRISYPDISPPNLASLTALNPSSSPSTSTPTASTSPQPSAFLTVLLLVLFNWTFLSTSSPQATVVQCSSCLRRVGLWTYSSAPSTDETAGKTFDLVSEHLRGCAYRGTEGQPGRWKVALESLVGREAGEEERRRKALQDPLSFVQDLLGPKASTEDLRKSTAELRRFRSGVVVGK